MRRMLKSLMENIMRRIVLTVVIVLTLSAPAWCAAFKDNGNGTVTDLATGLTWQQQGDNTKRSWAVAGTYCRSLSLGGKSDWRLPDIKELQSIVDNRLQAPAVDGIAFPGTNPSYYWSATTPSIGYAWHVSFLNGYVDYHLKSTPYYVRCVR